MNRPTRRIHGLAVALLIISGSAQSTLASDRTADTDTTQTEAIARLEAAQLALAAAQAEYMAAQAELTAAQAQAAQSVTSHATTSAQPESADASDADNESASAAARKLAWNEGWEYTFSAGISGSSGNNENFAGRVKLGGSRATEKTETKGHASYLYSTSEGQQSASRGEIALSNDWLLDGPWRLFAQGMYEYDEFQAWQHRMSAAAGVGYEFINTDKTTLIGRAGLGASYEFGKNADEKLIPEGLLGLDWTHQYSKSTKLVASTTYYPSFNNLGEFRWNSNAGIEVMLDEESNMSLNAGLEHRHDSDPGSGIRPNDVDYYMGIGWKF